MGAELEARGQGEPGLNPGNCSQGCLGELKLRWEPMGIDHPISSPVVYPCSLLSP